MSLVHRPPAPSATSTHPSVQLAAHVAAPGSPRFAVGTASLQAFMLALKLFSASAMPDLQSLPPHVHSVPLNSRANAAKVRLHRTLTQAGSLRNLAQLPLLNEHAARCRSLRCLTAFQSHPHLFRATSAARHSALRSAAIRRPRPRHEPAYAASNYIRRWPFCRLIWQSASTRSSRSNRRGNASSSGAPSGSTPGSASPDPRPRVTPAGTGRSAAIDGFGSQSRARPSPASGVIGFTAVPAAITLVDALLRRKFTTPTHFVVNPTPV